jgi:ketosteroid isomerase-like protein
MSQKNYVRVQELFEYIREGRILDAMHEFYDDEVVMEEPAYGKTIGLKANIDREQKFVDSVAEFKGFEVAAVAVGEDVACYENVMDWISQDGQEVHVEQVSVQRWRNGKIVHERFYYSNG